MNAQWLPLSPKESLPRTLAGATTFAFQKSLGISAEVSLGRLLPAARLFHHFRDTIVSETLKSVYFPLPKCACTTFATLFALYDESTQDYEPQVEGVHTYRRRTRALRPTTMDALVSPDYFRFTVVRSPWTRAVAAFLDKIVKPWKAIVRQPGQLNDQVIQLGQMSFNDVVHVLHASSDARLEKHWRPQISFIRGVELDYLGSFEHLDRAFDMVGKRLGIDMRESVIPRVRSAKRTNYQAPQAYEQRYFGNVPARELALMERLPYADAFYDERSRALIAERFHEDVVLYRAALGASD